MNFVNEIGANLHRRRYRGLISVSAASNIMFVMTPEQLRDLPLKEARNLRPLLRALWADQQGDWNGAHELAQEDESRDGCWLHAYLHRKEGDASNAAYWYRRAGKPLFAGSFDEEWLHIAISFLAA